MSAVDTEKTWGNRDAKEKAKIIEKQKNNPILKIKRTEKRKAGEKQDHCIEKTKIYPLGYRTKMQGECAAKKRGSNQSEWK